MSVKEPPTLIKRMLVRKGLTQVWERFGKVKMQSAVVNEVLREQDTSV